MTKLLAFLAALALVQAVWSLPTINEKFIVYRAFAHTPEHVEALRHLQNDQLPLVDFWKEPRLNDNADIMVDETTAKFLTSYLKLHKIGYEVMIEDVFSVIEAQDGPKNNQVNADEIDWNSYYDLPSIERWLDGLASRENSVSLINIGKSGEGRDMRVVKLSNGRGSANKPAVLITATIHAREWIAASTATYIINQLGNNTAENADILDSVDVYILPVINPDGYSYTTANNNNRLWRKTRSSVSGSSCIGTDANRNFGFKWGEADVPGSSSNPCSDTFRGPSAFSEPEAANVRDFVENNKNVTWAVYITLHSYGQYFLCPWGYTKTLPPNYPQLKKLSDDAAAALYAVHGTRFTTGSSANVLYYTDGTDQDWAYGAGHFLFSYTMELRDTGSYGFLLPARFIVPTAEETFEALRAVAKSFSP